MSKKPKNREIAALRVNQWMKSWDRYEYSDDERRRKPSKHFYLFSMPAVEMRRLCGIARRDATSVKSRSKDLGIQRQHDEERSDEIAKFVESGYPWSTLSNSKQASEEYDDLRKPGWLPTAIVINILKTGESRNGVELSSNDSVSVSDNETISVIKLPYEDGKNWKPRSLPPFEVIDGQHRLWAFDNSNNHDFEIPVVAFYNLDISWQAYLFWVINIKPKKINPSLAFDLYPLLRAEDWLERGEGHAIYRENRSQELTEALWANTESPWHDRINMLGERRSTWVTQSAWIRTLMATFVRSWSGKGVSRVGGLFGSRQLESDEVLGWTRAQQAAFLVQSWEEFRSAVYDVEDDWTNSLRTHEQDLLNEINEDNDPAFYGKYSLLTTDQGVRGFLYIVNDIFYVLSNKIGLSDWILEVDGRNDFDKEIERATKSLKKQNFFRLMTRLSEELATFDWRASSFPELSETERRSKIVYRGSSGYKELRIRLFEHLSDVDGDIGKAAQNLLEKS